MLKRAVALYEKHQKVTSEIVSTDKVPERLKISWKLVAEYVARYGSYRFGNATCRKKWDEINMKAD